MFASVDGRVVGECFEAWYLNVLHSEEVILDENIVFTCVSIDLTISVSRRSLHKAFRAGSLTDTRFECTDIIHELSSAIGVDVREASDQVYGLIIPAVNQKICRDHKYLFNKWSA